MRKRAILKNEDSCKYNEKARTKHVNVQGTCRKPSYRTSQRPRYRGRLLVYSYMSSSTCKFLNVFRINSKRYY